MWSPERASPEIARLSPSVPPLVNTISTDGILLIGRRIRGRAQPRHAFPVRGGGWKKRCQSARRSMDAWPGEFPAALRSCIVVEIDSAHHRSLHSTPAQSATNRYHVGTATGMSLLV